MHKSTVSLALSGKGNLSARTRERVLSVARELGYEPNPLAQRLARGEQSSTVCIVSGVLDLGLTTDKLLRIQKALGAHAWEVPIYTCAESTAPTRPSQAAQIRGLCRQRPRAIVCAAQGLDEAAFVELENYRHTGGIVVGYDVPIPVDCDQVLFDRRDNAYQAARHLLERGHRRLGLGLSGTTDRPLILSHGPQADRLAGFRQALAEFGVPFHEPWLFLTPTYEQGGAEMARRFLQMADRPTGLCIVNDYVALAFMVEIMRAGVRVPDEVSLVGHDDQPIAAYCPVPLSTTSQPTEQIARAVVTLLEERLAGSQAPPQTVTIRGELTVRASVAPPKE